MESHADNQAMVEVSLGLAMAFFALMILAVVSMNVEPAADPCLLNDSVLVAVEQSKPAHPKPADKAKSSEHKKDHVIVVFYQGRYFDVQLQPVNPGAVDLGQQYLLALPPNLPLAQVLAARAAISAPNLRITELTPAWLVLLGQLPQVGGNSH